MIFIQPFRLDTTKKTSHFNKVSIGNFNFYTPKDQNMPKTHTQKQNQRPCNTSTQPNRKFTISGAFFR